MVPRKSIYGELYKHVHKKSEKNQNKDGNNHRSRGMKSFSNTYSM